MLFGFYRREILLLLLLLFSRQVAEARSMLFSPNFNVKMAGPASITGRYLLVRQEVVPPPLNNKKLDPFFFPKTCWNKQQIEINNKKKMGV